MNDISPKEAIANLNHLYGMVSPDIQRSLDVAIKALERPTGDLISREALIREIGRTDEWYKGRSICNIIDNAMSMHYTFLPQYQADLQGAYDCGYIKGLEDGKPKQGEWKITEAYPHKVYCSECYKTYAQEDWEVWKDFSLSRAFCPNCGADMRGGKE